MEPSLDDFRSYIFKMREKICTSPSGTHLGIYINLLQDKKLFSIEFEILCLSITHRIILHRWIKTHQIILQKEDVPNIHRLRYIKIVEADIQYLMKQWWEEDLQRKIEKDYSVNAKQYARRSLTTMSNLWSR